MNVSPPPERGAMTTKPKTPTTNEVVIERERTRDLQISDRYNE